ncbi:hypothetical protein D3C87_1941530 [compost metagenome]
MADALLAVKEIADLLHFADRHLDHRLRQNLVDPRIRQLGGDTQRLGIDIIAGVHGDFVSPFGFDSRLAAPCVSVVDDVVVDQRRAVNQL